MVSRFRDWHIPLIWIRYSKKIIKCMTFNDIMVPSSLIFHELEFLKLNDINNLQIVSFVYECINGLARHYFKNFFTSLSAKHTIGTCQSKKATCFWKGRILPIWHQVNSLCRCKTLEFSPL